MTGINWRLRHGEFQRDRRRVQRETIDWELSDCATRPSFSFRRLNGEAGDKAAF